MPEQPLRLGLIGCGTIARSHARNAAKLPYVKLAAFVDTFPDAAKRLADEHKGLAFSSVDELLAANCVDAVVIATPHFAHAEAALAAIARGVHAFIEKPLAVDVDEARRVVEFASKHPGVVVAIDYNQRHRPIWKKIRSMISAGELGEIHRIAWTITDWFRPQSYYDSGGWRGTWAGEGGGLLVNQIPHNLDLLCWFFGNPVRVQSIVRLGKHHAIEVDDDVHALIEFDTGIVGTLISSTGEGVGTNRLEIVGDAGTLVAEAGRLTLRRTAEPVSKIIRTQADFFAQPKSESIEIELDKIESEHLAALANFVDACLGRSAVAAPAAVGIAPVELANAILLSSLDRVPVDLPLEPERFVRKLDQLRSMSKKK